MGRDLTSTSLMAYLTYLFDIEDGFSNSKSIKQYGSSYSFPDMIDGFQESPEAVNLMRTHFEGEVAWDSAGHLLKVPMRKVPVVVGAQSFLEATDSKLAQRP